MARKLTGVLVFALAALLPSGAGAAIKTNAPNHRFVPGEALVRYAPGTDVSERRALRSAADVDFEESLGVARTQLVGFDGSVRDAIARLEGQPGVAYAQPNYVYHALAAAPNDTHFGHLWGLGATPGVGALPAWDRSLGAGQVIAVVDTGVDLTHPDLVPNLWSGPGGIHGHDFVDNDDVPDDFNLHGSHVAGTAAAVANNALGVAGVAPQAQIMGVRVLDAEGGGPSSAIANGIAFAANAGAGVINLSLGGPAGGGDQAMSDAITLAETRGAVVVAAAGNGGDDGVGDNNDAAPVTPCNLPNANLICVAAVTKTGARSAFSNFGPASVDLGAPGGDGSGNPDDDILSAKPAWTALFSENFQTLADGWTASGTGAVWGLAGGGIDGESATDSPGTNYQDNTNSQFQHTGINLTGQRGCRLDFFLRLNGVEDLVDINGDPVDAVGVGVATTSLLGEEFSRDTPPLTFERIEFAVPGADNRADVKPTFTFRSDFDTNGDGAYVDDYKLLCRGSSYPNTIAGDAAGDGGDYTAIAGTSMASPHVAGVAALVRAVDPGGSPSQIVQALRNGAKPAAGMAGVTVTGGVVDAIGAMDASLAIPNPQPPPSPPKRPSFSKIRVSKKGVVTLVVKGDAGNTGVLTLTANIKAARVRNVGRKTFRIRSTGRATVKVKLKKPALKQLKRKRKLKVKAKAVVKNAAGLTSSRTATIRLKLTRRR
jgi:subtilisin family serine protease